MTRGFCSLRGEVKNLGFSVFSVNRSSSTDWWVVISSWEDDGSSDFTITLLRPLILFLLLNRAGLGLDTNLLVGAWGLSSTDSSLPSAVSWPGSAGGKNCDGGGGVASEVLTDKVSGVCLKWLPFADLTVGMKNG